MTLAAGGHKVVGVDHGVRVGGRQDFVVAVATGAVGDDGRAVLRRQAVVTFQVGFYAVSRKVILVVQINRGVAAAADLGNFQRRAVLQRLRFYARNGSRCRWARRVRRWPWPCRERWPPRRGLPAMWHRPHVCAWRTKWSGDAGDVGGRMSCEPWQSTHVAASSWPALRARP